MFVGYQRELAVFIGETREELENLPLVELTRIEEVDRAVMIDGVIYIDENIPEVGNNDDDDMESID